MEISRCANPKIIFDQGALSRIGESLARLGVQKVFLITDPGKDTGDA